MSSKDSNDVLQSYLSDLLGAGNDAWAPERAPAAQPKVHTEAKVQVEPCADKADKMPIADEVLLATKRDQLQKLLHSARVQVEQVSKPPPVEPKVEVAEPAPQAEIVAKASVSVEAVEDAAALSVLDEQLQWLENGRPRWAQETFEVLLFKVSGLTLAVPLISLGQIQPLTDELTPLFGQADWFMGLQPTPSGKVRTVNTARFVMPERYDPNFEETAKYVISINGVPWGLAVDTVEQPIRLDPEDVKWRSSRTQRPWLAGTVKAHMCALLDIPMVGKMLTDADRNARPGGSGSKH